MDKFLDAIFSIDIYPYSESILIFLTTVLSIYVFKNIFSSVFKKRAEKTESKIDDALSEVFKQVKTPLILIFGLYTSLLTFELNENTQGILSNIFRAAFILQCLLLAQAFIKLTMEVYAQTQKGRSKELMALYDYLAKFLVFILWVVGILLFLSNAGYDISSLIASLGIGGLAIALAVQNILKDLFSTAMILINKPFQVGDYVKLSDKEQGTIQKIGIRNTIIKTVNSEELIVTNDDMLNSRLYNFRGKTKKRVTFDLFFDLETTSKKIEVAKKEIIKIINSEVLVDKKKTSVVLSEFTERATVISIVYKMLNNDYSDYLEIQDRINLRIKSFLEKEKIELAKTGLTQ